MVDNNKIDIQYLECVKKASDIFKNKTNDYGTSWRILRPSSLTDQIWIKAMRIRSIQDAKKQLVKDSLDEDFIGIINYCIIAIIQIENPDSSEHVSPDDVFILYDKCVEQVDELFKKKNHDYGEAWRGMRISSMTDLILAKLIRIKQIESNQGVVISSEGVIPNYQDIINYSIFCLIHISEGKNPVTN